MNVRSQTNFINFKGYDAIPLQGLYMQGLVTPEEQKIFKEMKRITKRENLDLFVNQNNKKISKNLINDNNVDNKLSIWAQDNKAFVKNKDGKCILWNEKEGILQNTFGFNKYKINKKGYMPRGGNYFLGFDNDRKWLLINGIEIYDDKSFETFGDKPTVKHLCDLFNVKTKDITIINDFSNDLDEIIRPIGFPYILVNDYFESLKNLEKLKKEFHNSNDIYNNLKSYLQENIKFEKENPIRLTSTSICEQLEKQGFKPIKIGGIYYDGINFINAIVHKKSNSKISYITNSTKDSMPELEYLEKLFHDDLTNKFANIDNIYFVSGGKHKSVPSNDFFSFLNNRGFKHCNEMMNMLANRLGGIHCMTSEIPKFKNLK